MMKQNFTLFKLFKVWTFCFLALFSYRPLIAQSPEKTSVIEESKPKNQEVFKLVEKLPNFPGGEDSLWQYLATNLKYPAIAKEKKITGEVVVQIIIEKDGQISGAKILDSLGYGCDEEALRVVKEMPKWSPGMVKKGEPCRVQYNLPIKFDLNPIPPKKQKVIEVTELSASQIEDLRKNAEKHPEFPQGKDALSQYLKANLKYPKVAKRKGITGEVFVQFLVDLDGSIKDAKVAKGIGYGCDEEALRLITNMPKWTPGKIWGEAYRYQTGLSIKFELP